MNLMKRLFFRERPVNTNITNLSIITGGNLKLTQDVVTKYSELKLKSGTSDNNDKFIIIVSEDVNDSILNTYNDISHKCKMPIKVFGNNIDIINYIKIEKLKVNRLLHLNHYEILTYYNLNSTTEDINYEEFKKLIKINIESPIELNTSLLNKDLINKGAKIMHLTLQKPFEIPLVFKPNKIFNNQLSNYRLLYKDKLIKNKITTELCNIRTLDCSYIEFLDNFTDDINDLATKIRDYKNYNPKAIDYLVYFLDSNSPSDFKEDDLFYYIDIQKY